MILNLQARPEPTPWAGTGTIEISVPLLAEDGTPLLAEDGTPLMSEGI